MRLGAFHRKFCVHVFYAFFSVFEDVPVPLFCVNKLKPTCTVSDHRYKACLIMFDLILSTIYAIWSNIV